VAHPGEPGDARIDADGLASEHADSSAGPVPR
jgi:hypothetical protein